MRGTAGIGQRGLSRPMIEGGVVVDVTTIGIEIAIVILAGNEHVARGADGCAVDGHAVIVGRNQVATTVYQIDVRRPLDFCVTGFRSGFGGNRILAVGGR